MPAAETIKARQIEWATSRGIDLVGRQRACTPTLEANLFQELSDEVRQQFQEGDGDELGNGTDLGKLHAVHSSAALVCNVFHYWRRIGQVSTMASLCGLPELAATIDFERTRPIMANPSRDVFPRDPNLDVVIGYPEAALISEAGIESKFVEPYDRRYPVPTLSRKYAAEQSLWRDLPRCHMLAQELARPGKWKSLDGAQLIRNILGLKHRSGRDRFCLLYLWYRADGEEGSVHAREVAEFAAIVRPDGIDFRSWTYQELISALSERNDENGAYVNYLQDRYG